ncbi:MAG TPA: LolA-related protein [Burkholderiales bacterium]|nr:LolA-related protein [Burkholderiales bacterium]
MVRMIERSLCVLLWLALSWAAPASGAWNVESLMDALGRTTQSEARFTETKHLAALTIPLELRGTLRFQAPDHLERLVEAPFEERFIVDGDRVTFERKVTGERHQLSLQSQPVLWAFIESIRATLRGDLATLQKFYRVELDGAQHSWTMSLLPREVEMGQFVSVIRISGSDGNLHTIDVQEANGNRSITRIEASR